MFEILLAGGRGYYPQSGPGNKIMIDGNIDLGYFGTVSSAELFKSSELLLKTGLSFAGIIAENVEWLKFAYKGKFLFVAKQPVKTGISWDVLYEKGLVYGLEGFGPGKTVGTDQLKILDKEGFLFKVRLMRGANTDPFVFSTTSYSTSETIGSEWNDLLYRVSKKTTNPSLPKWEKFDNVQLGVDYYSVVQELSTSGHAFIRGGSSVDYSTITGVSSTSSSFGWRPVLEVIDPKGYLFRAESIAYKTEYMWAVGGLEYDLGWGDDTNQIPLKSPYGFEYTGESLEPVIRMTGNGGSFIRPIGDITYLLEGFEEKYLTAVKELDFDLDFLVAPKASEIGTEGYILPTGGVEHSIRSNELKVIYECWGLADWIVAVGQTDARFSEAIQEIGGVEYSVTNSQSRIKDAVAIGDFQISIGSLECSTSEFINAVSKVEYNISDEV